MSWLCCEDEAVAVSGVVDAFVLSAEVEAPLCSLKDYALWSAARGLSSGLQCAGAA